MATDAYRSPARTPTLIKEWKRIFPHHQYDTNYGLTECTGPGCVHLGMENMHKVGAIGLPGFDWEIKVVDDQLNPVAKGQPGELIVKGPGVMKEYYKNPEATRETLIDGWLLTGDVARQDEDGFIWLVDRKKDVIITGGENIYPVEIEDFLQAHPKIHDVAVIGLPSLRLGETPPPLSRQRPVRNSPKKKSKRFVRRFPDTKDPEGSFSAMFRGTPPEK